MKPISEASPSTSPHAHLQEAGARQVVVTRTVRDLATGTDLAFASIGSVGLRGIPGQWELFQATLN